jgi:hypothetical protein
MLLTVAIGTAYYDNILIKRGTCIIRAETVGHTRDIFSANFLGIKLINVDGIFGL